MIWGTTLKAFWVNFLDFVEKKQLFVLFLQLIIDNGPKSGYYWFIVIRKSDKGC